MDDERCQEMAAGWLVCRRLALHRHEPGHPEVGQHDGVGILRHVRGQRGLEPIEVRGVSHGHLHRGSRDSTGGQIVPNADLHVVAVGAAGRRGLHQPAQDPLEVDRLLGVPSAIVLRRELGETIVEEIVDRHQRCGRAAILQPVARDVLAPRPEQDLQDGRSGLRPACAMGNFASRACSIAEGQPRVDCPCRTCNPSPDTA